MCPSSANKKTLSVDSPSFTPTAPSLLPPTAPKKATPGISPKFANAAPFKPQGIISSSRVPLQRDVVLMLPSGSSSTTPFRQDTRTPDRLVADVQEFVPGRRLDASVGSEPERPVGPVFDSFAPPNAAASPYIDPAINGTTFYQNTAAFQQPPQYHLYAPIGPYSNNLLPYQRTVHDLFIPNDVREEMHKKLAATLQILPNSQLPAHIENYHSLVPLDTSNHKRASVFGGYASWVYKAQSSQTGQFYVLRRIEGFRLTNEQAIRTVQAWKQVLCASVVRITDAFTNRGFGDSSLFFVTDYHPLAQTLAEHHHIGQPRQSRGRNSIDHVAESVLWSYVCQIASALKVIHSNKLAARVLDITKVLVAGKNRVRLNGCAVLDVVLFDKQVSVAQLQKQDLVNFGLVILSLGANVADASQNFARAMDQFKRHYKPDLQDAVIWLYSAMQNAERSIDQFITMVANQMINSFDGALHNDDALYSDLASEVENARLFRLMAKLSFINERPEFDHDRQWSENGERYYLKLFRDYVFHQVDAQNRPVIDLGHVLSCLNKLDAGTDERVTLISRDEQTCFVVSYKELKKGVESAFQDLAKSGRRLH
ncbi:hypothetical protein DV737_g5672, partial [Chaetothyriales sp. CBS 132003]